MNGIARLVKVAIVSSGFVAAAVGWARPPEAPAAGANPQFRAASLALTGPLYTQDWDWESAIHVRYKSATGEVVPLLLPWFVGAFTDIPLELALDHKKADGWVLLYNTVDGELRDRPDGQGQVVEIFHPAAYIALYNRYRGILRFFYLHTKEQTYTDFLYGLEAAGLSAETTLLNFAEDFAKSDQVPVRRPFLHRANIKKFDTSGPILYHWHSFDVELAYDPLIDKKTYAEVYLRWLGRGIDVSKLELKGDIRGSLIGSIDIAGSNTSLNVGSLTFNAGRGTTYSSSVTINNAGDAAEKVKAKAEKQQDGFVKAKLDQLWKDLQNKTVNFVTSPLSSLFGSLIGGPKKDARSADNVNLRLAADVDLHGTMTLAQPIFEPTLKVPGTTYGETDGTIIPHYDKPLGVLTLSATPEVVWVERFECELGCDQIYGYYTYAQDYAINGASFEVKLNPHVAQELRIKSVQRSLYYYRTYMGATKLEGLPYIGDPSWVGGTLVDSEPSSIIYQGGGAVYTRYWNVFHGAGEPEPYSNLPDQRVVVRVIVELERVDANGQPIADADPIVWSKTFRPRYTQIKL